MALGGSGGPVRGGGGGKAGAGVGRGAAHEITTGDGVAEFRGSGVGVGVKGVYYVGAGSWLGRRHKVCGLGIDKPGVAARGVGRWWPV